MTELERQQMKTIIDTYKPKLPAAFLKEWEAWCRDRDIVAKKLRLTEDQKLYLSARYILILAIEVVKNGSGYYKLGPTKFAAKKGSSKIAAAVHSLQLKVNEIRSRIPTITKLFESEMDKLNKKSR